MNAFNFNSDKLIETFLAVTWARSNDSAKASDCLWVKPTDLTFFSSSVIGIFYNTISCNDVKIYIEKHPLWPKLLFLQLPMFGRLIFKYALDIYSHLTILQVCMLSILLAISKYIIIPVTSIIVVISGADTIAGSSFK